MEQAHTGGEEMEDSQSVPYRTASGRRVTKRSMRPTRLSPSRRRRNGRLPECTVSDGLLEECNKKFIEKAWWMAERLVTLPAKQVAWVRFPVPARPTFCVEKGPFL
jgi:hypothetical protein